MLSKTKLQRKSKVRKQFKFRTLRVFSRDPSHKGLRKSIKLPFLALVRLGSTTVGRIPYKVEINSPEAVRNSANKFLMKKCFTRDGVKTADWWVWNNGKFMKVISVENDNINTIEEELPFPLVAKHIYGSRGTGNTLIKSQEELDQWMIGRKLSNYIFEKYYPYVREYRLHVTEEGCFYTCRKMLKEDTPEEDRWHRHDSNSVWFLETNPKFDKPVNWNEIVEHCVKAIKAVGLDIGACDVKVQGAKTSKNKVRETCDFIVLETNSAPSFGEITLEKYKEELPKLAKRLLNNGK
jgi:carbamoylphosphate synthase large subunit